MRILLSVAAALAFCFVAGASNAADLPLPHHRQTTMTMPLKAQPKREVACLKWVPENYSWYNYCDPVPYYGKHQNHWFSGPF